MNWSGKKVLVTGAGGFIGSHLCEALVTQGADVTALLRYTSLPTYGNLEYLDKKLRDGIEIVRGNVEDKNFMEEVVKGKAYVFHLAALIGIPYSYLAPGSYLRTNVEGTLNLLDAVKKYPVEAFVHTSTSEVYGTALYTPIDEAHPLQGQSPYSASKIAADKFVDSYVRSFGVRAVTVRPFNTYGPRQSARAVIPTVLSQAISCEEIKVGSLTPVRDFVYVSDTVKAFLNAATTPDAVGKTIHVGTGVGITISQLLSSVSDLLGQKKPVVEDENRVRPKKSEVFELLCNPLQAKNILNWVPSVKLEEGLKKTATFIREHLDIYRPNQYAV